MKSAFSSVLSSLYSACAGIQWTHGGHTYQMFDCGICYMFYFDGTFSLSIDGVENAYTHAFVNHYNGVYSIVSNPSC